MAKLVGDDISDEPNKIYIIGETKTGKTSFLETLMGQPFMEEYNPSDIGIGVTEYKSSDNKFFTLKDLSDDKEFKITNILKNEIEEVLMIFVLFSLTDRKSFEYAKGLVSFVKNSLINNVHLPIILLGNKYDLIEKNESKREISSEEVEQFIMDMESVRYSEISCKTRYGINDIKDMINAIEIENDESDEGEEEEKEKEKNKKNSSCILI